MRNAARRLAPRFFALLLAGCSQQGPPPASRTISGTCLVTYFLDDGSTTTLADCGGATVTASGLDGAGRWIQAGATVPTSRGFSVLAPAGNYLLGVKYPSYSYWEYFETALETFALDANVVGRPDAVGASAQTIVTFNVDGMDPWDSNDYLELTSSGASTFKELVHPSGATALPSGAISALLSFDWYGSASRLPDGSRGDVVYLHQDTTMPVPGTALSYQTATRFVELPATFAVANGTTQSLNATLGPVPQTGSLSVDWRTSTFEQYRADIHPDATGTQHLLLVDANPHTLSNRPHLEPGTPDMVILVLAPGTTDQNLVGIPYGQFLPSFWVEYRLVYFNAGLAVTAPGATSAGTFHGVIGRYDPLPAPTGPVTPGVTPPRAPRIGGLDAFQSPSSVGTTPTLSWSLPAVGVPTSYTIAISQPVLAANGGTAFQQIAFLTTSAMSLIVPPGLLQPGVQYVALITAYVKSPDTSDSAPYRLSFPYAYASAVMTFST